jgi:hypothetical protein
LTPRLFSCLLTERSSRHHVSDRKTGQPKINALLHHPFILDLIWLDILSIQPVKVGEVRRQVNAFIRSTDLYNPVPAFQNRVNAVAGTDFYANLPFRKTIQEAAARINETLLIDEWEGVKADTVLFEQYARIGG